jgi:uncharacterized protein (DUF2252 family)
MTQSESVNVLMRERPYSSIADRLLAGRALRKKVSRPIHAEFAPDALRADPVAILEAQARHRLQSLIPIRHARMAQSPLAFFRGAAAIMMEDLARTPVSGLYVQACGDMHLSNFGLFATTERRLVFGINDFDETLPGPWEWDVKRLAASMVVAAQDLNYTQTVAIQAVKAMFGAYKSRMYEFAAMGYIELAHTHIDSESLLMPFSSAFKAALEQSISKARGRNNLQVLEKMTDLVDQSHRLVDRPPFIAHEEYTEEGDPTLPLVSQALTGYLSSLSANRRMLLSRYRLVDFARQIVGIGSVGMPCWIFYLEGSSERDPLFLQFKGAGLSVLAPYVKRSLFKNQGQRVVVGQHQLQGAPDMFLGHGRLQQRGRKVDFYVRQLRDMKGGIRISTKHLNEKIFKDYCALCGWSLALGHAKSGDAAMISGYIGQSDTLQSAVLEFALRYAGQNRVDYQTFLSAIDSGRIPSTIVY